MIRTMTTPEGRRIAFHQTAGLGPGVVFLGGYKSDMTGTKALHLQDWAERTGRAFLRFDYSGHGQSEGTFDDLGITEWFADACAVIAAQTTGPQVLVGSSMGGWIALLVARAMPDRVAGLIGVAAAPDFTQDLMWDGYSASEQAALTATGWHEEPSEYSDAPNRISVRFLEDGARNLVLRTPLDLPFPVRLLQGSADRDVPPVVAQRLFDHVTSADLRLVLVKGADHRFSTPDCLGLMVQSVQEVLGNA